MIDISTSPSHSGQNSATRTISISSVLMFSSLNIQLSTYQNIIAPMNWASDSARAGTITSGMGTISSDRTHSRDHVKNVIGPDITTVDACHRR